MPAVVLCLLAATVITLDRAGTQGPVAFNHSAHVKQKCSTCHHTRDFRGVIELTRCGACHGAEAAPHNPRNRASDEVHRKRAFHDQCIGCHIRPAVNSAASRPVACADCHQPRGAR